MNLYSFSLLLEKQTALERLNNLLPNVGLLNIENLGLFNTYLHDTYPIDLLVKAYFGKQNYTVLETYMRHNIIDSQIIFEVCQYFKTFDDVCEYLIVIQHLFFAKTDNFEFFINMAFVSEVDEITSMQLRLYFLKNGIDNLDSNYTTKKNKINNYVEFKNTYLEKQHNIKELKNMIDFKYSYLKLKRFIKKTTPIGLCCN